jgi:hypothetical protein
MDINNFNINFDDYKNNHQNLLIKILLQLRMDVKLYHWNTKNYSRHKISDDLLNSIDDKSDKIIEVMLGKYNIRPNINDKIIIRSINDLMFINLLKTNIIMLENNINHIKFISFKSLIDELLVDIYKTLYLLSFE